MIVTKIPLKPSHKGHCDGNIYLIIKMNKMSLSKAVIFLS